MHNLYPPSTTAPPRTSRAARGGRSSASSAPAGTGAARCAQVVWGGDPTAGWGFDGLRRRSRQGLSMGLSGISTWGSDIGGFFALGASQLTPELLTALGPVRRRLGGDAHAGERRRAARQGPPAGRGRRPDRQLAPLREAAHPALPLPRGRRRRLPPHRAADHAPPRARLSRTTARATARRRVPVRARPAGGAGARAGRDASARSTCRAAAGSTSGARSPTASATAGCGCAARGRWRGGAGSARSRRRSTSCRCWSAPARSCRCCRPTSTRSPRYGGATGLVQLRDRADRIDLLAFPRGRSSAALLRGGRIVSSERRGRWTLRGPRQPERAPTSSRPRSATLKRPLRPCRVLLDGRRLPASHWRYRAGERVLDALASTAPAPS